MTSPEHGPSPATSEMDKQRKLMEEKERQILQSRMKTVTLAARNKVVNFLRKYILGKKPEDKQKVVDQGKEKEKKDKPEAESETETPDQIINRQFSKIHEAQNMGKPLTEAQQQFISRVSAEAAVDPLAQKQLKLESPETDPTDPTAEVKKLKPTMATIQAGAITPEMLLRYDFSDYKLGEGLDGQKVLERQTNPTAEEKLKELAAEEANKLSENKYRRRIFSQSEVTPEMQSDPEFQNNYELITENGDSYYRKRGLEVKPVAGGADGDEEDRSHISHPPRSSDEERARAMNLGAGDPTHDMSDEEVRDFYRKFHTDPEFQRQQWEKRVAQLNEADQDNAANKSTLYGPRGSRIRSRVPGVPDTEVERLQNYEDLLGKTFFFPPTPEEGETEEAYNQRKEAAKLKYFSAEESAIRLDKVRKGAIYLSQTLEGAQSEREVNWIIEDTLRAGESDLVSPDTFQQAVQSAIQAVDLVFASDQGRRKKITELIRGRQAGYACEFTARYINAGELGKNITNFFQEYFESMMHLPGVSRMMQIMEERDAQEGTNIRGAYFRKLNYDKNDAKKAEWHHLYKHSDLYDDKGKIKKDPGWGVWVVDKKFQLYNEALVDNTKIKLDYLNQYKDDADKDLVKVLLVKSHSGNNPVQAIKDLHRVVFSDLYKDVEDYPIPEGYHLPEEIKAKLYANDKLRNAIRILTQEEREARGALEEDKTTLTQSTGVGLDRMIYELNRSVTLGQRIEHSLQFSTHWDNLRWKKDEHMSDEQKRRFEEATKHSLRHGDHREDYDKYGKNVKGNLVVLNPVVEWVLNGDPRYNQTGEKITVNLRIAAEKLAEARLLPDTDPRKQELLNDKEVKAITQMRGAKNHLFTIAWDKAWREFYEKNWDMIDFEGSFSGDSSREARKAQYFGRTLEQSGEAEPGKRFLRRYADTGVKDMGQFFAFASAFDMVDNFGAVFNRVKRWSHLMQEGNKMRGTLMTILNDPAMLADPVKFVTELKKNYRPIMSTDDTYDKEYYSDEEYFEAYHHLENQLDYVTGQWAEAIIEYNKENSWQQHAADLRQEVLVKNVSSMVAHELITPTRAAHILDNQFGPFPKRILYEITHVLLRPKEGILGLLGELIEESGKAWAAGLK